MNRLRLLIRLFLRLLFRFRIHNPEALSTPGPVLLIPNHVSWIDWLFIGVCLDDDWKFVTSSVTAEKNWFFRKTMINSRTFPIDPASPFAVKRMAEHLQAGGRLVLFAEGRLSRTGSLMKFFEGTGFLLLKTHARVITCYLRGADRTKLAAHSGWKHWFPSISAHFSEAVEPPDFGEAPVVDLRRRLTDWLRDIMVEQRFAIEMAFGPKTLYEEIEDTAALLADKEILEDVNRKPLNYRRLMVGADLLANEWRRILDPDEREVGVLMPNVNAIAVLLLSLWKRGRTPVILNYTSGPAVMLTCARLASFRRIVTSRAFLEASGLELDFFTDEGYEIIFLEDLGRRFGRTRKLLALLGRVIAERTGGERVEARGEDTAAILFTSGSENVPKGVKLSHRNLLANIRQVMAVTDLVDNDRVMTCLPIFHSFGLTIGLLLPLVRGLYTFLYVTPLRYRVIPSIVYDRDCTILLSTNTFLAGYARKAHAYDFRSLRYLFAGAEKLQASTSETWARRFGVRIMEGYGATECSPCLSLNTSIAPLHGSVGRLLPGMDYCLEPVEMIPEGGRLFVKGPNIMQGYLNADADAAFKALDGWYDTGDIVKVDDDRFIHILGRQKRFAKVSGEMVSLTAVEEALAGAFPKYGLRFRVAIMTKPDERKGETLVAVTNEPRLTLEAIREAIRSVGLSNLCRPSEVRSVREIPRLGSGKTDYRALEKMMAEEGGGGDAPR